MSPEAFKWLVNHVFCNFNQTVPRQAVLEVWAEKLAKIPDEPVRWIVQEMEKGDSIPKNFPNAIFGLWRRWLADNPDKRSREQETRVGCRECIPHGDPGWLWVTTYAGGVHHGVAICRCASPQGQTVAELEALGFGVESYRVARDWLVDYHRTRTGFYETYGREDRYKPGWNLQAIIRAARAAAPTEEDLALEAGELVNF